MSEPTADGVLPVDKPVGPTSHDVVAWCRRALSTRKIGHTGTLDPFASGLLLLCVGRATRLAEYITALDKTYEAVVRLGVSTDTHDRQGTVVAESDLWRRPRTRIRQLHKLGTGFDQAIKTALSRKSVWHLAKTLATQTGMTNEWLKQQGLVSIRDLWISCVPLR